MIDKCIHKGCRHEREQGFPYCPAHLTNQILLAVFRNWPILPTTIRRILSSGMTRAERLLFVLTYKEGMTAKEIGAVLDLSESTVWRIHSKLLDRIYPHLRDKSELLYPFSPDVQKPVIIRIREFNKELITYLAKHPNQLYKLNPREFEQLIAHILETLGFDVKLTAPTRDGGYDIVAFGADSIGIKTKYIVECKRYGPDCPVGVRLVRSLYGIKDLNQAHHAVLATTSYFTRDAVAFAQNASVLGLHLKDLNEISKWLKICANSSSIVGNCKK
jgi:HJR/Mrr/RecB family endonuclease